MKYLVLLLISFLLIGCKTNQTKPTDDKTETVDTPTSDEKTTVESNPKTEEPTDDGIYTITINEVSNGKIIADKKQAVENEYVAITVIPNDGYILEDGSLCYNNQLIENNWFYMPKEDVVISANFIVDSQELPDSQMYVLAGDSKAYYQAEYQNHGILMHIYVVDNELHFNKVLDESDGVDLLISLASDVKGMDPNHCIRFKANGDGYYELYKAISKGSFSDPFVPELNVAFGQNFYYQYKLQAYSDGTRGYYLKAYFGYDLLNTTKNEGFGNITICPGLIDKNNETVTISRGQTGYGYYCYWKNSKTFALVDETNQYIQRATGTDEDILDESELPEHYIYGANFTGKGHWSMAWITFPEAVDLTDATALIVEVRFNKAVSGDWFRLGAATTDNTFYDAFGKDSSTTFKYSCSENIKPSAHYDWETGQWGGWDPSWNSNVAPTYYVEVPFEYMFARFNLDGTMTETVGKALDSTKKLQQAGIYVTASAEYDFSIGRIYLRKNDQAVEIANPKNYSLEQMAGKNYVYAAKLDSDVEKESSLVWVVYVPKDEE